MKKYKVKRTVLTLMMAVILLCGSVFSAVASDVMPAYENCSHCMINFGIVDGIAEVYVQCDAQSATFTYVEVEVKIQKKFLGVFWRTVDIGLEDNVWRVTSTELFNVFYECFSISDTGTYRAVFDIRFYGTTGEVDVIEDTIQCTYS